MSHPTLREKIGQMLLIGFRGCAVKPGDPVLRDIQEQHIGGIILFDQEMSDTALKSRNIQSPGQVRELTAALQRVAASPLLMAIDQEGGRVNRLKPDYGFPPSVSHEELGAVNDTAATFDAARAMARTLAAAGLNLNLAPVVDLDLGQHNPIIKAKRRSFSADPEVVARHAIAFCRAHQAENVFTCAKHFPGHGSARGDTHLGLVDVTAFWSEQELIPFQRLIEANACDLIMTAHVFNSRLDANLPATLSRTILQGILRQRLGFAGVIISDDMEMKAIASHYGLETAMKNGIDAGLDLFCLGNNMSYDPDIGRKAAGILARLVEQGEITEERIDQSYQRLSALKQRSLVL